MRIFKAQVRASRWSLVVACVACGVLLAGCMHPIGAKRVSGRMSYRQLNKSALNSDSSSSDSRVVLHRHLLTQKFESHPAAALKDLHAIALKDDRRNLLFALAELNFLYAERLQRSVKPGGPRKAPDYFLCSAIYAHLFLFGLNGEVEPNPFDRRLRIAADLYNRAVVQGFATVGQERTVRLEPGIRSLPPGEVQVRLRNEKFKWNLNDIEAFLPADEFELYGLSVRDRRDGLGSPLIVVGKTIDKTRYARRFPACLFLHVPADLKTWNEGKLSLDLELISTFEYETIETAGGVIRLEGDTTAPMAYGLNDASLWKLDMAQFFSSRERIRTGVYFTEPYSRGKIPLVFVHGTASSPIWWAEMWNSLRTDPALRENFQSWFFIYNTGNPISQSANRLREELSRKIGQLDPNGEDEALRRMVVIGHSQGGLLTKLTVTESGDKLWRTITTNDLASLDVSPEVRAALQTNFFFSPLPFVERVVFVATPHRGSYLATSLVRRIARKFISLPRTVLMTPANLMSLKDELDLPDDMKGVVPTSLDGMWPRNKWLLALADIPPAPGVKAHSVVAIRGNSQPPEGGDGVVKYKSAHVPYVDSEFVVRSSHSCQGKPEVIEEVRRILLLHVESDRSEKGKPAGGQDN